MDVEVSIENGRLRGTARRGHQVFLGVPFARAPLGALRFAPPEPAPSWSGVRDAVEYGASAPQARRAALMAPGPYSEDCLFLNVFTPRADRGRRPVLVWIHGG